MKMDKRGGRRLRRSRVLVVEDDAQLRLLAVELLSTDGHVARGVPHGAAALVALDGWRPDLVLLDLDMPVMDGRAFLRAFRQRGEAARVVLFTASDAAHLVAEELGADGVLTKPFDAEDLLRMASERSRR